MQHATGVVMLQKIFAALVVPRPSHTMPAPSPTWFTRALRRPKIESGRPRPRPNRRHGRDFRG